MTFKRLQVSCPTTYHTHKAAAFVPWTVRISDFSRKEKLAVNDDG